MPLQATKYTPRRATAVVEAIEGGHSIRFAAARSGVTHPTVLDWIKKRPAFALRVEQARAAYVDKLIRDIPESEELDLRTRLRIAGIKDPDGWGEQTRIEHTGEGGGPIAIALRLPGAPVPPSERP